MPRRPVARLASAAVVTGIATLALAAPASAQFRTDPVSGGGILDDRVVLAPAPIDPGWELGQLAAGALIGIALTSAAVTAAAVRRHQSLGQPA